MISTRLLQRASDAEFSNVFSSLDGSTVWRKCMKFEKYGVRRLDNSKAPKNVGNLFESLPKLLRNIFFRWIVTIHVVFDPQSTPHTCNIRIHKPKKNDWYECVVIFLCLIWKSIIINYLVGFPSVIFHHTFHLDACFWLSRFISDTNKLLC